MEGCDMFWPCIDYPTYEPDRIDLHITVPAGLVAPSNGVFKGKRTLPDGRTTWNWSVKHPTLYGIALNVGRSEEHTSELQSLLRISYAVFCLNKKQNTIAILHHMVTRTN